MKQWILSLTIMIAMGITSQHSERIPASEDDCPREETVSLYESVQNLLAKYRDATVSLVTDTTQNFNLRSFMSRSSFGNSGVYESPFFANMGQGALNSYHSKVMALQEHHTQKMTNRWIPTFNEQGSLTNGHYGLASNNGLAIEHMYANPTFENPYMASAHYYSDTSIQEPVVATSLPATEYYGPQ